MNFGELDQLFRREIDDEVGSGSERRIEPWQSFMYANDAQDEACRRGRLLVDSSTAAICQIAVTAGTNLYTYDPRIISIRRAKLASRAKPLGKVLFSELDEIHSDWESRTGTVEALVTGMDTGKLRMFRIPIVNDTLNLTVVRLALQPMVNQKDTPEINTRHHRSLVYWMKHKAFNNQDSELFDKNRADIHLALFEQEFGPKSAAINEVFEEMNYAYGEIGGYY
jgi:hypothetical protein